MKKILYFIYSLMYIALSILSAKGVLLLFDELVKTQDYSIMLYIGIVLFALVMFVLALINCLKEIIKK